MFVYEVAASAGVPAQIETSANAASEVQSQNLSCIVESSLEEIRGFELQMRHLERAVAEVEPQSPKLGES
jgi:hypothetical protein